VNRRSIETHKITSYYISFPCILLTTACTCDSRCTDLSPKLHEKTGVVRCNMYWQSTKQQVKVIKILLIDIYHQQRKSERCSSINMVMELQKSMILSHFPENQQKL